MTTHNITKEQRPRLEIERRNSLARYLNRCTLTKQQIFLSNLKPASLRDDIKERMREELAKDIAKMETNPRNLRLARLQQRCQVKHADGDFFADILCRVRGHLNSRGNNG